MGTGDGCDCSSRTAQRCVQSLLTSIILAASSGFVGLVPCLGPCWTRSRLLDMVHYRVGQWSHKIFVLCASIGICQIATLAQEMLHCFVIDATHWAGYIPCELASFSDPGYVYNFKRLNQCTTFSCHADLSTKT